MARTRQKKKAEESTTTATIRAKQFKPLEEEDKDDSLSINGSRINGSSTAKSSSKVNSCTIERRTPRPRMRPLKSISSSISASVSMDSDQPSTIDELEATQPDIINQTNIGCSSSLSNSSRKLSPLVTVTEATLQSDDPEVESEVDQDQSSDRLPYRSTLSISKISRKDPRTISSPLFSSRVSRKYSRALSSVSSALAKNITQPILPTSSTKNDRLSRTTLSTSRRFHNFSFDKSPSLQGKSSFNSSIHTSFTQAQSSTINEVKSPLSSISEQSSAQNETSTPASTFFFLELPNGAQSEIMERAFWIIKNRGLSARWISDEEALNLPSEEADLTHYFVFLYFAGQVYDSLKDHPRWRLYSPLSIIHFFSEPLPERDSPLIDICMRRCHITISGLPREARLDMEDKLRMMGATISASLKDRTTHIIATSWSTEKCSYARSHGWPLVMSPYWAEFCWDNCQNEEPIDAYELAFHPQFRLPVFTELVICGTNLARRGHERLCDLVTANGGLYESEINFYRTTHLVITKKEGPDFEKAIESEKIKIVSPDWIHDSISRGFPLPEEDLAVRKLMNKIVFKMIGSIGTSSLMELSRGSVGPKLIGEPNILIPGSPESNNQIAESDNENTEITSD